MNQQALRNSTVELPLGAVKARFDILQGSAVRPVQ